MSIIKGGSLDRRGFLKTTAATAAAATLPWGAARAQQPKRGGHLRFGMGHGSTTDTLDPATYENSFTTSLSHGLHSRLTEVGADGSIKSELAESWEATDDATEWRFKVRKGVEFHSGKTVTLEDVVESINYHRGENSTSAAKPIVEPISEITTEGNDTVVFKLSGPNADFPFVLSDYHLNILPVKDGKVDWRAGDGLGSYKLVDFDPGVVASFERNENYYQDDRAFFDSIEMLSLVDQNARTTALVSGDVDAIDRLDLKTVGLMQRGNPNIKIQSVPGNLHYTFAMLTNQDPFTDNNVRLALKHAVNREEMVEKILFGYGVVGNDHPIGRGQRYFNDELEQTTYDPDKARYYLKQAGLDSLSVGLSAADAAFLGAVDSALLFRNSAEAADIDVKVVREPNDGYWSDVWMKKPFSAVYWSGRVVEDQMFTTTYQTGAAWNDTFWSNERFDELLVKARGELDEDKRRQMYYEMQAIVNQQGGAVIPMFASWVFAHTDKVAHPEVMGSNWDVDGMRWMERWWFA
ncbi:peptide ABC transporter, periplasmic peptide-binding protein [Pseudooceanicola batsensis HTCC2597]|uniref:Peptide ABC transporter, periplasmic peptide-binding protein n=1 Tax=Pseudooceanicola batsensis (strain ATCC BAA-863 / DSM 15984 / KCTC 12145 / HTCC2597) TaxID=252305 RepID=A3TWP9_PSEBH|nr:ABC transporter substrate-binding protein [Pseudooceanicola batsensis]EAQ04045.1 peptide ABC transporter, periplasmic peptide-binding protein [Pseudooceanicola batsensis HTCC2597]